MITLDMMPPLMFGGLILAMLIGFPVAFTLAALGLSFGFLSIYLGFFDLNFLQAIPGRIFGGVLSNELLLAIPFFTFMGSVLERCGLAEDMLDSMGQLFGPVRGGLGYSVIIVGFILGAITGTVAAQVIAMALISMPVMMRYGYNIRYITGVLAASGTITQLVPPSLVLIVMADQLGKSVGDMYLGAWGPSVLQIALFAGYTFMLGLIKPDHVPPVPPEGRTLHGWALWKKCLMGIIPSARADLRRARHHDDGSCDTDRSRRDGRDRRHRARSAPPQGSHKPGHKMMLDRHRGRRHRHDHRNLLSRESLLFKLSFAVVYIAVVWLCLEAVKIPDLRDLIKQGYQSTMRLSTMVVFILIGSTCFSVVFLGVYGGVWLEHHLTSIPGGVWGFLIFINLFIFFLAFFLDFFEIAFIILPMVAPDRAEDSRAGGRRRCRADLVRRHALRQHADLVPASAVRLRAVLSARRRAEGSQELGHLLGRGALDRPATDHGGAGDRLPDHVTALLDKPIDVDLSKVRIEVPQIELPPLDFGGDRRNNSGRVARDRTRKTPELSLRGFLFGSRRSALRSALRVARHEAVVTELGDLPPLVAVGGERGHRIQYLLEVRIAGRGFGVQSPWSTSGRPA